MDYNVEVLRLNNKTSGKRAFKDKNKGKNNSLLPYYALNVRFAN